jgi:hypothetical protein
MNDRAYNLSVPGNGDDGKRPDEKFFTRRQEFIKRLKDIIGQYGGCIALD